MGGIKVTSLLDSGSSTSLIVLEVVEMIGKEIDTRHFKRLVSATGNQLGKIGKVSLPVKIGELFKDHEFTVVSKLVIPVILGIDFLVKNEICIDFKNKLVKLSILKISFDSFKSQIRANEIERIHESDIPKEINGVGEMSPNCHFCIIKIDILQEFK